MNPTPRILMCRPEHFGIEYEINPWMRKDCGSDRERAIRQWESLVAILRELGVNVELLEPRPGLPDMVFTANAGLVHQSRFIPSHFRHPERQGETPFFERWFIDHGFEIADIYVRSKSTDPAFEGAGDALYCGETLVAGYLNRSDICLHRFIGEMFSSRVLSVELVDPYFYHLDTCFCPLAPGEAIYYRPAFDPYAQRAMKEYVEHLIEVDEKDARRFGCNAVVVGKAVVINAGCERLADTLRDHGYEVFSTDLFEFLKSGGSAKCLTLRLDGEEAASWRYEPATHSAYA